MRGRLGQADLFAPRQRDVELGLYDAVRVDVHDADRATLTRDVVDHGLHRARVGRLAGYGRGRGGGERDPRWHPGRCLDRRGRNDSTRAGHGRQRRDGSLGLGRVVGEYQRDHQPEDQQHRDAGGDPQPARRCRAFRRRGIGPVWRWSSRRGLALLPLRWQTLGRIGRGQVRRLRRLRRPGRGIPVPGVAGRVGRLVGVGGICGRRLCRAPRPGRPRPR